MGEEADVVNHAASSPHAFIGMPRTFPASPPGFARDCAPRRRNRRWWVVIPALSCQVGQPPQRGASASEHLMTRRFPSHIDGMVTAGYLTVKASCSHHSATSEKKSPGAAPAAPRLPAGLPAARAPRMAPDSTKAIATSAAATGLPTRASELPRGQSWTTTAPSTQHPQPRLASP